MRKNYTFPAILHLKAKCRTKKIDLREENETLKSQISTMGIFSDEYARRLELQEENERLKKIISKMAKYIDKHTDSCDGFDPDYKKACNYQCEECITKYFENVED